MKLMTKIAAVLFLFASVGLAGCASKSDIDALQIQVNQANATADAALKTANEAKATAQDAKVTAETAENKIDRMFKKAMYK